MAKCDEKKINGYNGCRTTTLGLDLFSRSSRTEQQGATKKRRVGKMTTIKFHKAGDRSRKTDDLRNGNGNGFIHVIPLKVLEVWDEGEGYWGLDLGWFGTGN